MQASEIIRDLKEKGIKATVTSIKRTAQQLGFHASSEYSDEQTQAIIEALMGGRVKPKAAQADSSVLAKVMEQGEAAIAHDFRRGIQQVKSELIEAKKSRDEFVEQASDALVTLVEETRPLIYHRTAEKLHARQQSRQSNSESFSLSALAEESFSLDFSDCSGFLPEGRE